MIIDLDTDFTESESNMDTMQTLYIFVSEETYLAIGQPIVSV